MGRVFRVVELAWAQSLILAGLYLSVGHWADPGAKGLTWPAALWVVPLVVVLVLAAGLQAGLVAYLAAKDQAAEEAADRRSVVAHVFKLGAAQRSRARTGAIVSTATDGVERAAAYRGSFLGPMIGSMTAPIGVLLFMGFFADWVVAGLTAIALPVIPLALGGFQAAFRGVSRRYRENGRVFAAKFLDAIQGLGTLRLMNADRRHGRTLAAAAEELRRHVMRLLAGNQLMLFVVDSLFSLAFIASVAGLSLWRIDQGAISPGDGLGLVLCGTLLLDPLDRIGQFFYIGMGGIASAKEIKAFVATAPAVTDPADQGAPVPDAVHPPASPVASPAAAGPAPSAGRGIGRRLSAAPAAREDAGRRPTALTPIPTADLDTHPEAAVWAGASDLAVELGAVDFAYGSGPPVLTGFSLAVARGEHVAIVGVSGAGKTTIAELIQGNLRPDAGEIRLFGTDVARAPLAWQRAQLAVVAQHTYLFTGTLRDNLLVAAPQADDLRLGQALAAADLAGFVAELPQGLDTPVGERGLALSGGQTQRLGIARAFLKDAPILILDEPTAHVDLAAERAILASLEKLGRDKTVIAISHRRATILHADRTVEVGP
ncbi:MAG: ABC transporter ATP-binding protein/permease [Bifidobacteriaceae bacterium]|jgi:ABC-type transport system involved in cytochrome bd biosynthesis fused ATPase/permease subunit|nr:ABC transporter ATP-binding protein/permease [Bifidobacteriaceae bacterium]